MSPADAQACQETVHWHVSDSDNQKHSPCVPLVRAAQCVTLHNHQHLSSQ